MEPLDTGLAGHLEIVCHQVFSSVLAARLPLVVASRSTPGEVSV